jgi:hypothetical protein
VVADDQVVAVAVQDGLARYGSIVQPRWMVQWGRFPTTVKNSGIKAEIRQERDRKEERRWLWFRWLTGIGDGDRSTMKAMRKASGCYRVWQGGSFAAAVQHR